MRNTKWSASNCFRFERQQQMERSKKTTTTTKFLLHKNSLYAEEATNREKCVVKRSGKKMVHTIYIDPIVKVDFKHCKWHGMCGFIAIIRSCCDKRKKNSSRRFCLFLQPPFFFFLLLSDNVHGISKIGSFFFVCLDQCFTNGLMVTPIVLFNPKATPPYSTNIEAFPNLENRFFFSFRNRNKWTIDAVIWFNIIAKNHRIGNSNYTANRNNELNNWTKNNHKKHRKNSCFFCFFIPCGAFCPH